MKISIQFLAGTYELSHKSPDMLPDKLLKIFENGTFELLEFEGTMAGAYQHFYTGKLSLEDSALRFKISHYRGFSNYLVDDALDDEERTTQYPHTEIVEGRCWTNESALFIETTRKSLHYVWRKEL